MNKQIMILVLVSLLIVGCNQTKFESKWTDQEIIIDGTLNEWQENMIIPKNSNVVIGFMNDETHLYLSLKTMDRNTIMQVLTRGFTVWFDPKGGKKQYLGFKYPMNRGMGGFRQMMQNREQNTRNYDYIIHELLLGQSEVEVIGPGKDQIARFGLDNPAELEVIATYEKGVFSYEMKIPLRSSVENVYAIDVKSDKNIGVGFTTQKVDRGSMKGQRSSSGARGNGMQGGGIGDPGGGMTVKGKSGGRGAGRATDGMNRKLQEAMEIWMKVSLATK